MKNSIIFKTLFILSIIIIIISISSSLLIQKNEKELITKIQNHHLKLSLNSLNTIQKNALAKDKVHMQYKVDTIARNAYIYLYADDLNGLKNNLKFDLETSNIKAIEVFDNILDEPFLVAVKENNNVLYGKDLPTYLSEYIKLSQIIVHPNEDTILNIGYVTLYYDKSIMLNKIDKMRNDEKLKIDLFNNKIEDEYQELKKLQYFISFVSLILILFIISFLLIKIVNKPLIILKDGLDEFFLFLQGNRNTVDKIVLTTNDEFGEMAKSLNENILVSAQLHEELNDLNENLELKVQTKVKENKEKDKLLFEQSKLASMGEMISNIAHQWRQPLSIIATTSTGMQMRKECGLLTDEIFEKSCENINENAQYLSKTIDDFKNFIEGNQTKKIFNLKESIESFLHLIESTIKVNNITIIQDIEENINIDGSQNELIQCLINIFNNAKDALQESDVEKPFIFISTLIEEDNVIIKIKDNAGGIPQNVLPRIFEPYYTTKHESQGTGLGLHMTHNLIVDGMKGSIVASNISYKYKDEIFGGAEFVITLPLH